MTKKSQNKPFTPEENDTITKLYTQPEYLAGFTLCEILPNVNDPTRGAWQKDTNSVIATLKEETEKLRSNDLSRAENTLLSQAQTLDTLFNGYILRAHRCEGINSMKLLADIALKAQRQCRATLETLALIKNPQPYVRQQNVAVNQQVNNAAPAPEGTNESNTRAPAPARGKNINSTNGLLTDRRGEYETLDTGGTATASGTDKELEAVAALNGSADAGRQSQGRKERL